MPTIDTKDVTEIKLNGRDVAKIMSGSNVLWTKPTPTLPEPSVLTNTSGSSYDLTKTVAIKVKGYSGVSYRVAFCTFVYYPECSDYTLEELGNRTGGYLRSLNGTGNDSEVETSFTFMRGSAWMIKVRAIKSGYNSSETCKIGSN